MTCEKKTSLPLLLLLVWGCQHAPEPRTHPVAGVAPRFVQAAQASQAAARRYLEETRGLPPESAPLRLQAEAVASHHPGDLAAVLSSPQLPNLAKKSPPLYRTEDTRDETWQEFHTRHFDWWMFPLKKRTAQSGGFISDRSKRHALTPEELQELVVDVDFMKRYLDGVAAVQRAWGIDIATGQHLAQRASGQHWVSSISGARPPKIWASLQDFLAEAQALSRKGNLPEGYDRTLTRLMTYAGNAPRWSDAIPRGPT